ncbi:MAG TPA: BatA domain-containing protein [Bacteroidota bacterium]|nr:BatA domain-containing protein [Bacteroidota bacterium]
MTFLNPLLLIGLVAAAIPIIIHLLNLRKLKTVEFSSLRFLKELQKTKMRRVKIRQLLLLILRTLLVIAVVLAFSRPAMKGSLAGIPAGGTTKARATIVIVLDDSPSMGVRNERGILFSQAKEGVGRLLDLAEDGDEVYLIRLSEVGHKEIFVPASSTRAVRDAVEKMSPSLMTTPFRSALGVAAKVLGESKNFNQEVYLVTDLQATQFMAQDSVDLFHERVRFFLIDIGTRQPENIGINQIVVHTQILTRNKPVSMQAHVRNFGTVPVRNGVASVYLDGARVVQQSVDVGAGGSASATFSIIPRRRGIIQGYVQLEDDAFEPDNTRYFVLNVPDNINVLMAGAAQQDTRLPALALTLLGDSSIAGLFNVRQIDVSQLSATDLSRFNVLAFCNVPQFATSVADRIAQFVHAGGGLLLFPGKDSDIGNYNEVLFPRLGILPARPPAGIALPTENETTGFLSFDRVDFAHPLFAGLFEQSSTARNAATPAAIESPHIFDAIVPQAGRDGQTIISLSNGAGFLTEYRTGMGRVLLFSVDAGLAWSDFPRKGLFAPLLHRSVVYLGTRDQNITPVVVGEKLTVAARLKAAGQRDTYVFTSPSGIDERIVPAVRATSGMATFESSNITESGIYQLQYYPSGQKGEVVAAVAVNTDPAESDLRRATDEQLDAFWGTIGVTPSQAQRLAVTEKIDTVVLQSRFGVELWKYLIGFAIGLALAEMAIGREQKSSTPSRESSRAVE